MKSPVFPSKGDHTGLFTIPATKKDDHCVSYHKRSPSKIGEILAEGRRCADILDQTELNMETEVRLLQQKANSLEPGLLKTLVIQIKPMINTARGNINDTRNHIQRIPNESDKSQIQLDEEKYSVDAKLEKMRESINAVFMTIDSHKPCDWEDAGVIFVHFKKSNITLASCMILSEIKRKESEK